MIGAHLMMVDMCCLSSMSFLRERRSAATTISSRAVSASPVGKETAAQKRREGSARGTLRHRGAARGAAGRRGAAGSRVAAAARYCVFHRTLEVEGFPLTPAVRGGRRHEHARRRGRRGRGDVPTHTRGEARRGGDVAGVLRAEGGRVPRRGRRRRHTWLWLLQNRRRARVCEFVGRERVHSGFVVDTPRGGGSAGSAEGRKRSPVGVRRCGSEG